MNQDAIIPASPVQNPSLHGCRVLVTGAGGFIGSHLVERLLAEGAKVRAMLRYNSRADIGLLSLIPASVRHQIELVFGDLRDGDAVLAAMRDIDVVFHLGALIAIPYSYQHPREVVETNVMGTLNVLMAAKTLRPARVIHTSTSEVYGSALRVPIDEEHPLQGQSPYSASKIGADKLMESFSLSYDVPLVTIRPFNTYGPRQSARAIIPTIISQALVQDEVCLGDLTPLRDFTFVADTVDGFIRAASAHGVLGQSINLGSGKAVAMGELAAMILRLIDQSDERKNERPNKRPVILKSDPARFRPAKSEVHHLQADTARAFTLLGWTPSTSLEQGLLRTIDWVRRHPHYFTPDRYAL
ncbi:MAG: SDR family NAD(P)-dependent oxidoreductase [Pseudomonadota bacterium]